MLGCWGCRGSFGGFGLEVALLVGDLVWDWK